MITIIAAIGKNRELGKDNDLIWHLPNDLKRFKKVTSGHVVIMGRKTFRKAATKSYKYYYYQKWKF
jgi:dihydrofolate reductase